MPLSSPAKSLRPIKLNLLGYSWLGNPGLPWRRLGSRCTATYTQNSCILGELRAGEDTASAALPLAEPLPSSKPFLLFHSPTCRSTKPPSRPPSAPHTLSMLVWVASRFAAQRCGHTGRHSASLRMHCRSLCSVCACVRVKRTHWSNDMALRACAKVLARPSGCRNDKCGARVRRIVFLCVSALFWVSVF